MKKAYCGGPMVKGIYRFVLVLLATVSPLLSQTRFQHIVMVIQENRTPDNLFGSNPTFEPGVDISRNTVSKKGVRITSTPFPLSSCYDITHTHQQWLAEYDEGKMDGFAKGPFVPNAACPVSPPHPAVVYV